VVADVDVVSMANEIRCFVHLLRFDGKNGSAIAQICYVARTVYFVVYVRKSGTKCSEIFF
jgi:hypothetical protein